MPHHKLDSEDTLEQAAIALFASLGWRTTNAMHEWDTGTSTLGRDNRTEVILRSRLRPALQRLNPGLDAQALDQAIEELARDRSAMSPARANREIYHLLKSGVLVPIITADGEQRDERVQLVDWQTPANNDFFLISQYWVSGDTYKRRADLVGFVNGLPILFVELKAHYRRVEHAFNDNLRAYRNEIPQIFWYNALVILSNGDETRVGSTTAAWEHFAEWKKINSEGEEGIVSLDTVIQGVCAPAHLLDLIENFTLFDEARGGLIKLVAKNHQYLGVNSAVQAARDIRTNQGRLGVFWHTQGSGKSYSMVFFAQKILRRVPGNWTFLIITDRADLDEQIYKNFAGVGAVTEPDESVRAQSAAHLRQLLREDHRYLFTLIQKFRVEGGAPYPKLSDRDDIIVITDEAHRSQYNLFAQNMRTALPNAAFIGFTGTPLIKDTAQKTREVFGDYISIYNFKQSIADGATVPLYYENRIPILKLDNPELNAQMDELLDAAAVDDIQEAKIERQFAKEYSLITDDHRLDIIAADIVEHFTRRGQGGKAMVVSIDKATAVKMYDKVQQHWLARIADLEQRSNTAALSPSDEALLAAMRTTDMAVVVSAAQNEAEDFKKQGLDIVPHRQRMIREQLDTKFKDPADPLRIVFVCAMWMTGFDVPSCDTIYLDKPMRNHTLMQTIARANRVYGDKVSGLIVDYIGVFRNLQQALAIYATSGAAAEGEMPVKDKQAHIDEVRTLIAETQQFCQAHAVDLAAIAPLRDFHRIAGIRAAADALLVNDETKLRYFSLAAQVDRTFRAILPDQRANEFSAMRALIVVIADKIRALMPDPDITDVSEEVAELLDRSIVTGSYVIPEPLPRKIGEERAGYTTDHLVDLSQIDFATLQQKFASGLKRTEAEKLRSAITRKLRDLVQRNRTRMNYLETFTQLINDYNAGASNVEVFFSQLIAFARSLTTEEQRTVAENLEEEELAIFDLITKPDTTLSDAEAQRVKEIARELLATLKHEKLVLDWRKKQQARAAVKVTIQDALYNLPETFTAEQCDQKSEIVYQHIYEAYSGQGRSIYTNAA